MADQERSLAYLLAAFADNTSADISPQDLRDFVVSMKDPHGSLSLNTPAATAIAVAGTYVKMAGTTDLDAGAYDFDMPADNRLRYTEDIDRHVHVTASVTMQAVAGVNQVMAVQIAINGALQPETIGKGISKAAGDPTSIFVHWDGDISLNDYIEVWVTNETSTNNVQADTFHIFTRGIFGA